MPYNGTWRSWPVVWMDEDRMAYSLSDAFNALSITTRVPTLHEGLCFAWSIQWLRRLFDHPIELPLDRICHIVERAGSAAATQFIHDEIMQSSFRGGALNHEQLADVYSASGRLSRLNFRPCSRVGNIASTVGILQLVASLQKNHTYIASFYGAETHSHGRFLDALTSVFGCCFGSACGKLSVGHTIALKYDDAGSFKIFDSTFGEFEIDALQLERFFADWLQRQKVAGKTYRLVFLFEVMRAEQFAPPPHNHLGRSYNWIGSD